MDVPEHAIFTIGHSTHSAEEFVGLLRKHRVEAVADVRSSPFSRFNPQFNRDNLEDALKAHGIRYVFLGTELGARSRDRSCYEDGRVVYERLSRTELFQSGLDRVERGSHKFRIALMCAEKEPLECHRTLLVADALAKRGCRVLHILGNGDLESHEDALDRLHDITGVPREDMFRSRAELRAEAIARQELEVAYVDETLTSPTAREEEP